MVMVEPINEDPKDHCFQKNAVLVCILFDKDNILRYIIYEKQAGVTEPTGHDGEPRDKT